MLEPAPPTASMAMQQRQSLRARVVQHVMLPLTLTWLLGTGVLVGLAYFFTGQAFDRALLDDAYAVASNVRQGEQALELSLSLREMSSVLFDQSEQVFFAVLRPDGSLVAGQPGLRLPEPTGDALHEFADITYQGHSLRGVFLRRTEPVAFNVVVAQTTLSRSSLLQDFLLYSIAPQVLLLLLLAWWLRRAIGRDLLPLTQLQQAVDQRDASDLTPVAAEATSRDVERLAMAVNSLLARLGQSIRAQREFAGNVAHELRTPLAGIRALADYGLAHQEPEIWRKQLQAIAGSQARASRLVDQLLALALADEARAGLTMEPVALDEIARETVLRFLPRADAAGVDLGARGLEQSVRVKGNAALIEGILSNLIDNALRYGRAAQGQASTVTVVLSREPGSVTLGVVDNGPGVSAAQQQALTQRWVQGTAGERLGEGAGLGLAIVAQYAKSMGAQFRLDSASGGLTASVTFRVTPD